MAKKQTAATETETITEILNIDGDEITVVRTVPAKNAKKGDRRRTAKAAPTAAQDAPTSPAAAEGDQDGKDQPAPDSGAHDAPRAKARGRKAAPTTKDEPKAADAKATDAKAANAKATDAKEGANAKATNAKAATRATKGKRSTKNAPPTLSLGDLAERFLQHLEAIGKSRATVFSYSIDLGVATRAFGTDTDAGTITEAQVAEFFTSDRVTKTRSGKAKSNLTIDKTRRVARQVFTWAATEGLIATSPIPADANPTRKRKAADAGTEDSAAA